MSSLAADVAPHGPALVSAPTERQRQRREPTPASIALVTVVLGALITASVTYLSWNLNRHNEERLLRVQTAQAAALISAAVVSISAPLHSAVQVAIATDGNPQQFARIAAASTGPQQTFVSASLWRVTGGSMRTVATVGVSPDVPPAQAAAVARKALQSKTFVVANVSKGGQQRIGYAEADPTNPAFVVYGERSIPPNRQALVESDSAFANLNYATYVGPVASPSALTTTDVPLSRLPISGRTVRESIPFGDTVITLIAGPRVHLGGALGFNLPWIFLVVGALLTIATSVVAARLVKRGRTAAADARTIAGLYQELDQQYQKQRTVAETLQRALLPTSLPTFAQLDSASRYVAGAAGVDIGGDWYSVIAIDAQHFAFVVGDVSGRGVSAAAIMARLRYTMRAYLLEGYPADVVLQMCAKQIDIESDGHFATVLAGVGDLYTRELCIANAGHLPPLLISEAGAQFITTEIGMPLGIGVDIYVQTTILMPAGSTLVCFTDGLVERRGEDIDVGLARLARTATAPMGTVEGLLDHILAQHTSGDSEDDIALLAFRWLG